MVPKLGRMVPYLTSGVTFSNLHGPRSSTVSAVKDVPHIFHGRKDEPPIENKIEDAVLNFQSLSLFLFTGKFLYLLSVQGMEYIVNGHKMYRIVD